MHRFETRTTSLPSRVYAGPFTIARGERRDSRALLDRLAPQSYTEFRSHPASPGQFLRGGNDWKIFLRSAMTPAGERDAMPVELIVGWGRLRRLEDGRAPLDAARRGAARSAAGGRGGLVLARSVPSDNWAASTSGSPYLGELVVASGRGTRMSRLSDDRWRVVSPYLDRALEMTGDECAAWIESLRSSDPEIASDLESLLEERGLLRRSGFLEADAPAVPGTVPRSGQTLGAYTLLSPIGTGGMGSVWLAERSDGRFAGHVAIKLLHVTSVGRTGEERFRREGNLLARLAHPHIARLIDAGVSPAGLPYLVLEHVEGVHIDRHCDERALGVDARVRLFLDTVDAVAHAHANLIVHRDIKPTNVLVDPDGQVKLLDFGIAKLLEPESEEAGWATRTGEAAMTPLYAAPEQLTGQSVTTATDVYALGVLLYILLSGRHPGGIDRSSSAELVRAVVETEPSRPSDVAGGSADIAARRSSDPRALKRALRGDLDTIVLKALKKEPSERYASADAMADDLRRYLARQPIRARADSVGYRAWKFATRHRLGIGAGATAILALVAGTAIAVWEARDAARQRDRAVLRLQRAEATNDLTSFLLSEATPKDGRPISNADLLARGTELIERRFAADPGLQVYMLLTLADRYQENQQFDRAAETIERAFVVSRGIGDSGLRATAACARAESLSEQGDREAADALLDEALTSLASASDAGWDEARCRVYESVVSLRKGDVDRAVTAAERAVALEARNRITEGRELEFDAWAALAAACGQGPRFSTADDAYRRMVDLLDAQGRGESRRAAVILSNWSAILQNAGQHLKAVPLSERAVRIARAEDTENGASLTQLQTYGAALVLTGRASEALPIMDEAVAKARIAGSSPRLFATLGAAANAHREAGELEQATRLLEEAEAMLDSGAALPAHYRGLLERHQARLALTDGDATRAVELATSALDRYEQAHRAPGEMLVVLLALAEAQNAAGKHDDALATADRALAMARERLGDLQHSYNLGQAYLERGAALAGTNDVAGARRELERAVEHLRSTVGPDASPTKRAIAELARLPA